MAGLLKAEGYSELCIQLPRCCVLVQDQSHVLHAELSDVSTGQAPHSKNCARLLEYGVRMRRCDKNAAISGNIQTRTCCTVTVRALGIYSFSRSM
jgi:hypothetical protein